MEFKVQNGFAEQGHFPQFKTCRIIEPGAVRKVLVGYNQQMSVVIGESVHDHEVVFSPKQDQILAVIFLLREDAEDTAILLVVHALNVLHAPGCPKLIHL
jgi:hypothetical protein